MEHAVQLSVLTVTPNSTAVQNLTKIDLTTAPVNTNQTLSKSLLITLADAMSLHRRSLVFEL